MATSAAAPTPPPHPGEHRSRLRAARARRHNPLLRQTDRQRDRLRILSALALVTALVLAALVGVISYRSERAATLRAAAQLHQVQALEIDNAVPSKSGISVTYTAQVRWTDPTGTRSTRQAVAPVSAFGTAGSRLSLWVDAAGRVHPAPASADVSAGDSVVFGGLVLIVLVPFVEVAQYLADRRLDRTDQRNWEREWQHVEPEWTGRH
jgi:hypothetical protein